MKTSTIYACQSCGYQSAKWLGRCPDCGQWNSLTEEAEPAQAEAGPQGFAVYSSDVSLLHKVEAGEEMRISVGQKEFDNVLGGGIVPGSVILIGGDPGIGKSTLLLAACDKIAQAGNKVLYLSGEESVKQTKLRADRLGVASQDLFVVNQTNVRAIKDHITAIKPAVAVIDSIQVVYDPQLNSAAGSVSQLRQCAGLLTALAKTTDTAIFLIGHVTKEGVLAGPRVLEHLVDTVLYFEGDRFSSLRLLRAVKNRFGSTDELGVFEMLSSGLAAVENPSALLLAERPKQAWGSVVVPAQEGRRPLLVEIQALISPANFGTPSRRCTGVDYNKLSLLLAVLEKRLGLNIGGFDVFVSVVGGLEVTEPAADLGLITAVASSFKERAVSDGCVIIGEVGLGAEVRRVSQIVSRVKEAQRLGFKRCVLPNSNINELKQQAASSFSIDLLGVTCVKDAFNLILERG